MTPIERAARALCRCAFGDAGYAGPALDDHVENSWQDYVPDARAVLRAIREPSEAMVEAATSFETLEGNMQHNEHDAAVAKEYYQAMIDAALEEG